MKMKLADYIIECERRAYIATGNPLCAWSAYGIARKFRREIPEWVLEYLDKSRVKLMFGVAGQIEKTGGGRDLGPTIASAFGLAGRGKRGTPFESYYDTNWWKYGRAVREYVKAGNSLEDARTWVAQNFRIKDNATIERAEKKYVLAFPEGEEELFIDEDDLPDFEVENDPEQAGTKKAGEPEA